MSYLTESAGRINDMFSAGQYGALIIVFACVYAAYKSVKTVISVVAAVCACLAVVYFIAPNFYPELLRLLYQGFMSLCDMAARVTTGS